MRYGDRTFDSIRRLSFFRNCIFFSRNFHVGRRVHNLMFVVQFVRAQFIDVANSSLLLRSAAICFELSCQISVLL